MTINYPGGVIAPSPTSRSRAARSAPRPRRKSEPGDNSQYALALPAADSPLRTMAALFEAHGWQADYVKTVCEHKSAAFWHNKGANALVVWRDVRHRVWCVCEIEQMSEAEMAQFVQESEVGNGRS